MYKIRLDPVDGEREWGTVAFDHWLDPVDGERVWDRERVWGTVAFDHWLDPVDGERECGVLWRLTTG